MDWDLIAPGVTGFVGAFLGAVVHPAAEHLFRGKERREETARAVGRQLRSMVDELIADSRDVNRLAFDVKTQLVIANYPALHEIFRDPMSIAKDFLDSRTQRPRTIWEPFRITDAGLRQTVEELNRLAQNCQSGVMDVMLGKNPDVSLAIVLETELRRKELSQLAIVSMDKAGWVKEP
jgi:hypothetical protein